MGSPILWASTLYSTVLVQPDNEKFLNDTHCWPFVRGIHRWLVASPHKGPVMCTSFPWHYVAKDELVSMGSQICEGTILLSHMDDLISHPYEIKSIGLCHTDELVSPPYETVIVAMDEMLSPAYGIATDLMSYRRVSPTYEMSVPLLCHTDQSRPYEITTVVMSYGGVNKSSVWDTVAMSYKWDVKSYVWDSNIFCVILTN